MSTTNLNYFLKFNRNIFAQRRKTLVNALLYHCKGSLSGINGVIRPGIVHRIDKDTSGLLVACKNDLAHKSLSEQFFNKTVTRNENAGRTFLVDPLWTFSTKRNIDVKVFENTPFNIRDASGQSANFVLVMGGGYGS